MNHSPRASTGRFAGFAALLVGIGLGRFAYPPLIPALIKQRWFSAPQADYLASTAMAGYVVGALIAGHRLWKPGPSFTIRASMIAASASFVTCAAPLTFGWFFLWRLLAGVAAGFLMVTAVPGIIARTPPEQRGRASGIIFTGIGAGIAAAGALIPVLARRSLPAAWVGIGIASFVLTFAVWQYWPRLALPFEEQLTDPRSMRFGMPIALLVAAYCGAAAGFAPHSVFWVDFIARGLHRGLTSGGHYWILMGVAAAAGPTIAGSVADRVGFSLSLRCALSLEAVGVGLPVFSHAVASLAMSSVLVGSMSMAIVTLAAGRVSELVPVSGQKQAWSWMTTGFSIVYAAGAWGLSFLYADAHSYSPIFAVGAAALIVGAFLEAGSSRMASAAGLNSQPEHPGNVS
ncbi:MAG: YbfB/YjiJ family MFS transporter [Candidatus Acidiferrales bacterium]